MTNVIEEAATALDALSVGIMQMMSQDETFAEIWGWNQPIITRTELARFPQDTAQRIRTLDEKSLSTDLRAFLEKVVQRANWITTNTVPSTPGGNAFMGVQVIQGFCNLIDEELPPPPPPAASVDWRAVELKKFLPPDLLRRLRSVEASLKEVEPRVATISSDITSITEAKSLSEDLPVALQDLEELRTKLTQAESDIQGALKAISENQKQADAALTQIEVDKGEVTDVLANLGTAYRAATTKGLAAAFSRKALTLNSTVVAWIVLLAGALIAGGIIAHLRFMDMQTLVTNPQIPTERLWVQAVLAVLGIGGPIWFAWVATKQIGQRFRMAEDYAYKATVAKAYEGFRLEALRVDPALESRLFANAIGRLEEAPLRLVEDMSHGSPLHELMQTPAFEKATKAFPELGDSARSLLSAAGGLLMGGYVKEDAPEKRQPVRNESAEAAAEGQTQ